MRNADDLKALGTIVTLGLLFFAVVCGLSFCMPCGCYSWTPAKDVPARCWSEFQK